MLKRHLRLLLHSILLWLLTSCHPAASPPPSATGSAKESGCVWRVDGPNGGVLYLCGTIHILRESDYPLPAAFETAYQHSKELVLELPPGASKSDNLTLRMRDLGTLPASDRLEQLLPAADMDRVRAWAQKRSMDTALLNRFHPWFVSLMMVAVEYEALGAGSEQGVDQHFEERAQKDGKPGMGLETVEEQLALFATMTPEQEQEVLQQTLAELAFVAEEYEAMIRAWKAGDLEVLQEMLFREAARHPELMERFLTARNRAWVPRLLQILERGGQAMVLVGAGHLGGSEGLLTLLKQAGLEAVKVEAVPASAVP